jgi:large subunit ribosomal protein LP0
MSGTGGSKKEKKSLYFTKLVGLLEEYHKILIVLCDNIGSAHMQRIRQTLRGKAVLLMGKNTMMRRAIRLHLTEHPAWEGLLPFITGNIGLVFTNDESLQNIRNICLASKVPAAAKPGIKAPSDVVIPKGITQLEPTKTSFLQALNIASKINKGTIEILQDVPLIKKGDKVGSSESTLLQMLDIRPFEYGLQMVAVYDSGSVIDATVLDMTDDDILSKFVVGVGNVASLSLGINFPTLASFPHVVMNAYKNLLSIAIGTDYMFPQAEQIKQMIENPEAFVSTSAKPTGGEANAEVEAEPEKDPEEEEDEGMAFDLFG